MPAPEPSTPTPDQIEAVFFFARACGVTDEGLQDSEALRWLADQVNAALERKWAMEHWEARALSLEALLAIIRADIAEDRFDPAVTVARIEAALHDDSDDEAEVPAEAEPDIDLSKLL